MFKFKGLGAIAPFESVDSSGCILTRVDLFTAQALYPESPGERVPCSSMNRCTDTQLLEAEGVKDLAEADLQISPRLDRGATLNTTNTMVDFLTGNAFESAVDLYWIGIGPFSREHSSFHFRDQLCRIHSRFGGSSEAQRRSALSDGATN